jgi:hypothetical protein
LHFINPSWQILGQHFDHAMIASKSFHYLCIILSLDGTKSSYWKLRKTTSKRRLKCSSSESGKVELRRGPGIIDTRARRLRNTALLVPSLSHMNPIHTLSPYLRSNLFTSSHLYLRFQSGLFLSCIATKIMYSLSRARMCFFLWVRTCLSDLCLLHNCLFFIHYSIILNKPYECYF